MMRKIFFCALCALALVACKKKESDADLSFDDIVVTGDAFDVTLYSASVRYYIHSSPMVELEKYGVYLSTNPDPKSDNTIWSIESSWQDGEDYGSKFTGLKPGTTYYYRAYVTFDVFFTYMERFGEIKSFTTPSINAVVTTEQPVIGSTKALLRGKATADVDLGTKAWFERGQISPNTINEGRIHVYLEEDGTFKYNYEKLEGGGTFYFRAGLTYDGVDYVGEDVTFQLKEFAPTEGNPIDMGLSVKWASWNVGASGPLEYGDYFSWGETAPKTEYTKENYLYNPETLGDLPLSADAANVVLGASWRMPTASDYGELFENSLTEWGRYGTTYGRLFISKKNNNTLFFPAAGSKVNNNRNELDSQGHYWTCSYMPEKNAARFCSFDNSYYGTKYTSGMFEGYTVRAVYIE